MEANTAILELMEKIKWVPALSTNTMVEMTLEVDVDLKHNETPEEAREAAVEVLEGDPDYRVTNSEIQSEEAGAE